LVIDALGRLRESERPTLRIVSPAPGDATSLRARAEALGVRIVLDAAVDDLSLIERYRQATATVCAARLEPFGLTPLESMACGTPVIAVNEGGYRETIQQGVSGLLVDRNPDAFADAIASLINKPALARAMGGRGRELACKSWSWEASGDRLESILQQLAKSKPVDHLTRTSVGT
jgi:glycosyltransferase involved in cell wall biosynthesis